MPGHCILPRGTGVEAADELYWEGAKDGDGLCAGRQGPCVHDSLAVNRQRRRPPIQAVTRALEGVRTQPYTVTDAASLVTPLTELSTFRAFSHPITDAPESYGFLSLACRFASAALLLSP